QPIHRIRVMVRRPAALLQTIHTFPLISPDKLIPTLPADPVLPAQLGETDLIPTPRYNELHLLFHHTGFLPGHAHLQACQNCYLWPRIILLTICPDRPPPQPAPARGAGVLRALHLFPRPLDGGGLGWGWIAGLRIAKRRESRRRAAAIRGLAPLVGYP